ncbi:hypothetical protein [Aquamicrobium defluvii]|uniref:Uncharacterized protein n=1 Tax=Aquamicrobium defluvii TaxID=69279 RepID=A0A011TED9_9HYPH|nr:hypothetical protein [Aquamicrobium defluvii]EXL10019.1 hypothetical protein BG36_14420 [Aquamicrobium defluvii]EZQ16784.1 hypothetical protein CF98_39900 [Halopseudomonas bauzanensis]
MESKHFSAAHSVASDTARLLAGAGVPGDDIVDAMLTASLAMWAAETGRHTAARELLRIWTEVRDGR